MSNLNNINSTHYSNFKNDEPKKPEPSQKAEEKTSDVAKSLKTCGQCQKESNDLKVCSRCTLIYYCNPDCQKKAWKTHKTICKEPTKETISATYSNFKDESKEIKFDIKNWDKEQIQQTGAKKVGIKQNKQLNEFVNSINSNFFSFKINSDNDVIAFIGSFCTDFINKLKSERYNGVLTLSEEKLKSLLDEQNYIEVMKYLWTEKDVEKAINFVKPIAEAGHAIFMMELFRLLSEQIKTIKTPTEENFKEALKWFVWGMTTVEVDIACNTDKSTKEALSMLNVCYSSFKPKTPQNTWNKTWEKYFQDYLLQWKSVENPPSPKWVMHHGLAIHNGINSMKPKENWCSSRKQCYEEITKRYVVKK